MDERRRRLIRWSGGPCYSRRFPLGLATIPLEGDQADSTAQFLDWFKTPMPSWGIFEYYRRRASGRWDQKAQGPLPGAIGMKKPATIAGG
jgi:hypothetical protein